MHHTIHGVEGELTQIVKTDKLFKKQVWKSTHRRHPAYSRTATIQVEVRYDDECSNGHNSFAVTGTIYEMQSGRMQYSSGCCIHEEIAAAFPELAHLIKWHLFDSRGPMHYIGNVMYHASNRDNGKLKGEPNRFQTCIKFGRFPILKPIGKEFKQFIVAKLAFRKTAAKTNPNYPWEIVAVPHKNVPGEYEYDDQFTLKGYDKTWGGSPFSTRAEAEQYVEALENYEVSFVEVVTGYSKGKKRELDHARSCAVWPEATDEELTAPDLKERLEARLPALLVALKADVEATGLLWEPTDEMTRTTKD